jgi:hypothetical protein
VTTNSSGQSNTPQVNVTVTDSPKSVKGVGVNPNNFSSEKSFVPIDSAIKALQQKKAVMAKKTLVGLSLRMLVIMVNIYSTFINKRKTSWRNKKKTFITISQAGTSKRLFRLIKKNKR